MRSPAILEFLLIVALALALIVKPAPREATAKSPIYSTPRPQVAPATQSASAD
jgi:hypothetical protein